MLLPHPARFVRFLSALLPAALVAAAAEPAPAKVWQVSEYAKLQITIDSATYGDTVLVAPGTYRRIVLRNGIRVISEKGPAETIFKHNTFWVVQADAVDSLASIEGFTIDGLKGAESVVFAEESQFAVRNCSIRGGWCGVRLLYSDLRVEGCTIRECQNGAYLFESGGVFVGNDIQLCSTAMMIVSSNPRILRSTVTRNSLGISVQLHSDPQIGGTLATANRIWNNQTFAIRSEASEKTGGFRTSNPMTIRVPFNFWGSDCPDSTIFRGPVVWTPWIDESGTKSIEKCAQAATKK